MGVYGGASKNQAGIVIEIGLIEKLVKNRLGENHQLK